MNTKRFVFASLAASWLAGCGVADNPIRIHNAVAYSNTCSREFTSYVSGVDLDIGLANAQNSLNGWWVFWWESNFQPSKTSVGGEVISGEEANDFIAEAVDLRYRVDGGEVSLEPASVPYYAVLRAGAGPQGSQVGIELLPPAQMAALKGAATTPAGYYVYVTFSVRGRRAGGGEARSNEVTFPIRVYQGAGPVAPASCPTGTVPGIDNACGGVLDSRYGCVKNS